MPAPRSNPRQAKSFGKPDERSRAKAEKATERTNEMIEAVDLEIPRGANGKPLVKITMTASELIPTGQYANVSVGPAQITAWIDPTQSEVFSDAERENLAKALNELAEVVEGDVIAVQRNLVLESLQEQIAANGGSK